jgi:hypothetical protein
LHTKVGWRFWFDAFFESISLIFLDVKLIFEPYSDRLAELDEYQPSLAFAIIGKPGSIIS